MIGVVTIILLILTVVLIIEEILDKRNPTPLMNDTKEFIFVNNIKTRKMYDGIKR